MKALYTLSILFIFSATSIGQTINIPADSIKSILCHKWVFDYITMGGNRLPSQESTTYEFFSDNTFRRWNDSEKPESGTWNYEPEKKWLHLKIKKKTNIYIISINDKQFVLTANGNKEPVSNDPIGICVYFKTTIN